MFIVESVGKKALFDTFAENEGFDNNVIFATKGRLYDLPKDNMGFSLQAPERLNFVSINKKVIRDLFKILSVAKKVFIYTDPDVEGEFIAAQVAKICQQYQIEYERFCLFELTQESFSKSLLDGRDINRHILNIGFSRRITNRYIGFHYTQDKKEFGLGTVAVPLLSDIRKNPLFFKRVERLIRCEDQVISVKVDVDAENADLVSSVKEAMSLLTINDFSFIKVKKVEQEKTLLSGVDAILLGSKALDMPIDECFNLMQKLYEKGDISYFRTDNKNMSSEAQDTTSYLAAHFGIKGFSKAQLNKKENKKENKKPHDALYVTKQAIKIASPDLPLCDYTKERALLMVLLRHILKVGKKNKNLSGLKAVVNKNHPLRSLLSKSGVNINTFLSNSVLLYSKSKSELRAKVYSLKKDQQVLKRLNELGLGTQSSRVYHAARISKQFVDYNFKLNKQGQSLVNKASLLLPALLEYKKVISLNDFYENEKLTLRDRVFKSLSLIKVEVKEVQQELNKNQTIHF